MKLYSTFPGVFFALIVSIVCGVAAYAGAQQPEPKKTPTPGPMYRSGNGKVRHTRLHAKPGPFLPDCRCSQTQGSPRLRFTPGDLLTERSQNGYFHLGDITLRLRTGDSIGRKNEWKNYSTAIARSPVRALPAAAPVLASADLSPTLPADFPLDITRTWAVDEGKLVLRFTLTNASTKAVETERWASL